MDTTNLAFAKTITGSTVIKNASFINDRSASVDNYGDLGNGLQYITIDLGRNYSIDSIQLWHYFRDSRQYHDVIVQLCTVADFSTGVVTVFNNDADNSAQKGKGNDSEYTELNIGKAITFDPVSVRYVRLYSKGNTVDGNNYYTEVQVFAGKPGAAVKPSVKTKTVMLSVAQRPQGALINFVPNPGEKLIDTRIYNIAGRCVMTQAFDNDHQSGCIYLDFKGLKDGTYVIKVRTNRNTLRKKMTI